MNQLFRNICISVITALTIALPSCDTESLDGDWDPMKWSFHDDNVTEHNNIFRVPADGATFTIKCTNYKSFWFTSGWEMKEPIDYNTINDNWIKAKIEQNEMTIFVEPNNTNESRQYEIQITAGDIFDHFNVNQSGK